MKIICVCLLLVIAFAKGSLCVVETTDPDSCDFECPCADSVDYPEVPCEEPVNPCEMYCPMIYEPICGFNDQCYQVFSNECEMNRHNCENNDCYYAVDLCYCEGQLEGECDVDCSFT